MSWIWSYSCGEVVDAALRVAHKSQLSISSCDVDRIVSCVSDTDNSGGEFARQELKTRVVREPGGGF